MVNLNIRPPFNNNPKLIGCLPVSAKRGKTRGQMKSHEMRILVLGDEPPTRTRGCSGLCAIMATS